MLVTALQDTHSESNRGAEPGKKFPGLVFHERTNAICKHFFSPAPPRSKHQQEAGRAQVTMALGL